MSEGTVICINRPGLKIGKSWLKIDVQEDVNFPPALDASKEATWVVNAIPKTLSGHYHQRLLGGVKSISLKVTVKWGPLHKTKNSCAFTVTEVLSVDDNKPGKKIKEIFENSCLTYSKTLIVSSVRYFLGGGGNNSVLVKKWPSDEELAKELTPQRAYRHTPHFPHFPHLPIFISIAKPKTNVDVEKQE